MESAAATEEFIFESMKIIGLCYPIDIWPEPHPVHPENATLWRGKGPFTLMAVFRLMGLDPDSIEFTTELRSVWV